MNCSAAVGNERGGSPSGDVNEQARGIRQVWEAENNTSGDEGSVRFISEEKRLSVETAPGVIETAGVKDGGGGVQFQAVASLCLYQTEGLSTGPTFADANLQICNFCHGCFIFTSSCVVTEVRNCF